MAASVKKAQSPLCCQLCDSPNAIKWKCKECALLMCDKCKDVHRRIKTSEEHTIISIQDIKKEGTDSIPGKIISSVVQTYTTNIRMVNKIILTKDECIYILYNPGTKDGHIVEARLLRASIKILKKLDIPCMDITKKGNDFVFSEHDSCAIKLLSEDGSIKHFLDVSPMIPLAKHFNQHGEFIVGLREQGPVFPSTQFSTRKLAIFGTDNKLKFIVEFDKTGKKLFSYIWRITTDSKDNMYAIDFIVPGEDGRIVALSRIGELNFIYAGHEDINSAFNPFSPTDIIVTQSNSILVTDKNSNALHLLNLNGETIAFQNTKNHGIELPVSLCFDSEGFLLIGCNVYKKDTDNAKMHAVKISM
ncbi:Hypothetical predicted protein [Mytilus galloprovincialis]|uniref:B box-type domain-containing protein n=1 Tax=Mytilus galloprovincialis TaxID=29158 RepID=A0A8B6BFY8_MYTGA|nr:Hypothetical predicted protein [Mytilus galloprovincialis]